MECTTQLNGGRLEISKGWQSLLLDSWKSLFVPLVDAVFVTKGDPNDVQSELIFADQLYVFVFLLKMSVKRKGRSMGMETDEKFQKSFME